MAEVGESVSRHVVLVGPMGAGKTTIGRVVAERLHRGFVDSDCQIVEGHGTDAAHIAAGQGVARLHELEAEALLVALNRPEPSVIAAAASIADRDDTLASLLSSGALVVNLTGDPDVLRSRAASGTHRRIIDPVQASGLARIRAARLKPLVEVSVDVTTETVYGAAKVIVALAQGETG